MSSSSGHPSQRPSLRPSTVNPSSSTPPTSSPSLEVTLTFSIEYTVPDIRSVLEAFVEEVVSEVVKDQPAYTIESNIDIFQYGTFQTYKHIFHSVATHYAKNLNEITIFIMSPLECFENPVSKESECALVDITVKSTYSNTNEKKEVNQIIESITGKIATLVKMGELDKELFSS
jgi:hypothetical protein